MGGAHIPGAAGVDGCKGGWVAAVRTAEGGAAIRVVRHFADLVTELPSGAPLAVDMPIGLPDVVGYGGRGPEALIRPLLGARRSSVFSIPSRSAVYAESGPFSTIDDCYAAHRRASAVARATSDPSRSISIQAFGIFAKIRELDALLQAQPDLRVRIVETHPEVAFWHLNGRRPMSNPKKSKGRVHPLGMEERKDLLARHGLVRGLLDAPPPRGAADDVLDACAMLLVAERLGRGEAIAFPDPPLTDSLGLPIAILA